MPPHPWIGRRGATPVERPAWSDPRGATRVERRRTVAKQEQVQVSEASPHLLDRWCVVRVAVDWTCVQETICTMPTVAMVASTWKHSSSIIKWFLGCCKFRVHCRCVNTKQAHVRSNVLRPTRRTRASVCLKVKL